MKLLIVGSSGSGKSTFARKLSNVTDTPVLHLDKIYHAHESKAEVAESVKSFIAKRESWIIDGNYSASYEERIPYAEQIIELRIGRWWVIFRVIKRSLEARRNKASRPDMASNFREKFDREYLDFLIWVWQFPKRQSPKLYAALEKFDSSDKLIVLKNSRQKQEYLKKL